MNKMRKNVLLAFGLMLMPSAFAANPVEEPDSLINLKGVVISANKIRVNRSSVPLTISVIDQQAIVASRPCCRCFPSVCRVFS